MTDSISNPAQAKQAAHQVMQRFVAVDKTMPDKRAAGARRADFGEIYGAFAPPQAAARNAACRSARFIARSPTTSRTG